MTVKSLLVKIGADITELRANLNKAAGYVEKHQADIKRMGTAFTVVGGAITGAIGLMIKSYVSAGDSLLEMSQRTGMSTTELSKLKYVASLCGTDLETVELAVKKMASSLVDAATKGGPAAAAFSQIGLKVNDLLRLTPDQQFDKIAKAVAAIEDPTIRAATAADIFGARVGTKLLPMLAGGVDAFEAMKEEALKLGIVMSDEDCRNADALRDALTKLQGSVTGIGNSLATTLIPIIQGVATWITNIAIKVKDWTKEHPELSSAIIKVGAALGILLTAIGPLLIVLPNVVQSLKLLRLTQLSTLGPIGLIVAALAGLAIGYLSVKAAQDKAKEAADRYNEVAANFRAKLQEAATAAGLTSVQFDALTQKYGENYAAMGMAIVRGKEGVALQTALKTVGQEHKEVIDAQKQAILDKQNAEINAMTVSEEAKKQIETIITTRRELTDTIKKGTLSEYEYQKWALQTAYTERQAAINTEITDVTAKHELLLLAKQSYEAQLAALEKENRDKELLSRIEFAKIIADQEATQTLERLKANKQAEAEYLAEKQSVVDAIALMNMSQLEGELYMIQQERAAKIQEINDDKTRTQQQKKDLIAIWNAYYDELIEKNYSATQIMADRWKEQLAKIMKWVSYFISGISDAFSQYYKNQEIRLDNETKIKSAALKKQYADKAAALDAENAKTLATINSEYDAKAKEINDNVKDEEKRKAMLEALEMKRAADTEALRVETAKALGIIQDAQAEGEQKLAEEVEKKKSELRKKEAKIAKATALLSAIVNTASAIAEALPNIPLAIAVGILGAVQIALIKSQPIPMAEGAIVKRPTLAMIGERGPEAVIPLDRAGGFGMGGAMVLRQNNYFYGNISSNLDIDEISRRLAERTMQAVSKGRRGY